MLHTTLDKKLELLIDMLMEESEEVEMQVVTPGEGGARSLGRCLLLIPSNVHVGLALANDGSGLAGIIPTASLNTPRFCLLSCVIETRAERGTKVLDRTRDKHMCLDFKACRLL